MNTQESCTILSPNNKTEECAKFIIDDCTKVFALSDIMVVDREYTFGCWVRSDDAGAIIVHGKSCSSTTDWQRFYHTFLADEVDLYLAFTEPGTYYIYHAQLEIGNKATDWNPAPEDADSRFDENESAIEDTKDAVDETNNRVSTVEASLQLLADSVITRVTDEDGNTSTLEQKGTGWVFSLSDLEGTVADALDAIAALSEEQASVLQAVDTLKSSVDEHATLTDYVVISEYNGQPCIELGEIGGDFKLRITNTEMYFMAGSVILTTVTNQKMIAEKIEVKQELQQGGFVWMLHGNGNLGLIWKGVDS